MVGSCVVVGEAVGSTVVVGEAVGNSLVVVGEAVGLLQAASTIVITKYIFTIAKIRFIILLEINVLVYKDRLRLCASHTYNLRKRLSPL